MIDIVNKDFAYSNRKIEKHPRVDWSMTKNNAFGGEKQTKKSNGEQSDLCDLEQVTLKPQLQVHHYLTTWLQTWSIVSERAPT